MQNANDQIPYQQYHLANQMYYQQAQEYSQNLLNTWPFNGTALYDDVHKGYIKVDKGSPDKGKFVIFYAVEKKDPMIFCNSKAEVKKEIQKLIKRRNVDPLSIRVFALIGGVKQKKQGKMVTVRLASGRTVKAELV